MVSQTTLWKITHKCRKMIRKQLNCLEFQDFQLRFQNRNQNDRIPILHTSKVRIEHKFLTFIDTSSILFWLNLDQRNAHSYKAWYEGDHAVRSTSKGTVWKWWIHFNMYSNKVPEFWIQFWRYDALFNVLRRLYTCSYFLWRSC